MAIHVQGGFWGEFRYVDDLGMGTLYRGVLWRAPQTAPTQGATPKCGSESPQLKGPRKSVGVLHPNSRGHTEVWESITQGPRKSMEVRQPNSKGHTEVWESITPTQGATQKRGSPSPQLKDHTEVWESVTQTQGAVQ